MMSIKSPASIPVHTSFCAAAMEGVSLPSMNCLIDIACSGKDARDSVPDSSAMVEDELFEKTFTNAIRPAETAADRTIYHLQPSKRARKSVNVG